MKRKRCVGCGEREPGQVVRGLGFVCELCQEVVEIVWEVEIERTREATRKVLAFVAGLSEVSP